MDMIPNIDSSEVKPCLHQIQRTGSVLEYASHDFKTDPDL